MRSLAHRAAVGSVAAARAVVVVALCGVDAVAAGDDGAGLLAGASVSAREALRETGHVGERAGAAAAARRLSNDRVEGAGGARRAQICTDDGVGSNRAYCDHVHSIESRN